MYLSEEAIADLQTKHTVTKVTEGMKKTNQTKPQTKKYSNLIQKLAICKLFPHMQANSGSLPMLEESVAGVVFRLPHACQVQSY